MKKSKVLLLVLSLLIYSNAANAQIETKKTTSGPSKTNSKVDVAGSSGGSNLIVPQNRKKVSINFEDDVVEGQYDAPEVLLMNSRKHIKYKDLFNTRNNFLDEIESNRGMFNGQRKNK